MNILAALRQAEAKLKEAGGYSAATVGRGACRDEDFRTWDN
jgi:hypothetical protein